MVKHKITVPLVPAGILQRERLFCLLENLREKSVVWISGPGGAGKTTLVSSYLEARKLPAIWYQVDERDSDPATFFYYMGLAAREGAPPDLEPLPLLTPEYLAGLSIFNIHYFQQLFNSLPAPCAVVFDNYQDISAGSPFHELLLEGLSLVPAGITVLVLSRNEPPPVLTRQDSAERFAFLDWRDLRFSFDEAKQFAGTKTERALANDVLTRLYTKTDGWIAGLLLILESLQGETLDFQHLEKLSLDKIFDYFADKIFAGSDVEVQEFLLKSAFLPGLTAQMAERLTGSNSSEQILSRLCRNRFFTEQHASVDSIYQYHPLFRAFLLSRAKQTFPDDIVKEVRRKAASLLVEAGRAEDAADLLTESADWDGLTGLVLTSAPIFVSEGRSETVRTWVERIPQDRVESVPGLLYWQGVCLLLQAPPQSRVCFRRAFDLYSQATDRVGMCLAWSAGATVSLYDGEFAPLDEWLSLLDGMVLNDLPFTSRHLEEQVVMSIFNAMAFRQPHHPDIAKWRERATPLLRGSVDIDFRLQSAVHLLVNDLWSGNFGRASFLLEQIQGMGRSRKISPMTAITIKNAQVLHAFFTGDCELGVTTALEALRLAEETGVHVWDSQLLGNGAACALSTGDFGRADELLAAMELHLEWFRKRFDFGYYHGLRGWQKSLRREVAAASRHLELSLEAFKAVGFLATEVVALNFMAENCWTLGAADQAGDYLAQAQQMTCHLGSPYLEFISLLNRAQLALDTAADLQAVGLLRQGLALGRAGGYVNGWFWHPAALLRVCLKALENDIEVAYVRDLIRRRQLVPEAPPLHLAAWPWPLKIHTLGTFELLRDDKPLVLTGKVKKPLELLKALIACGGMNVTQERLSDALWPDADGDLAQRSFDTTLHRLRKLLGNEKVLQLQAGRLSLNSRYCWLDTWAFDGYFEEIEKVVNGKEPQGGVERLPLCFAVALGLYKGRFLPEDTGQTWTFSLREQLRSRFLALIGMAGGYFEALGEWEQAATWYRKGLETDSLAAKFEQRLRDCCRQQG